MKVQKIFCCLLIILLLYLYRHEDTYTKIVDFDKSYQITSIKNQILFNEDVYLNLEDKIINNVGTYEIKEIIDNKTVLIDKEFIGDKKIIINPIKKEIPIKTKEIHTIFINEKMIPQQLYLKQNSAVKWKNKLNNIEKIICNDINNKNIFISKNLSLNDMDIYVFTKLGKYEYYRENDIHNRNIINIID